MPGWLLLLLALPLLACAACASAGASADTPSLRGEWRPVGSDAAAWQSFEPALRARIPRGEHGAEIRLSPRAAAREGGEWVLVVHTGPLDRFRWVGADGREVEAGLADVRRPGWIGHGRIGVPLASPPDPDTAVTLTLLPQTAIGGTLAFSLERRDVFLAEEVRWVALISVCLALLAGMALVALVFAVRLRDATFVWYAVYLASYAVIQLLQTGYAASPLGWSLLLEAPRAWGRSAVAVSIVMIVLFLVRFGELRRFAPRTVRPLHAYAAAVAAASLLGWMPIEAVQAASRAAINPLLILGGPLLLGVALRAWWRGSRYAGVFVVGWTPLLLVTVAGSLQLFGLFPGWMDEGQAPMLAAAFEALVLSAGLADRIALVRRDRDIARAQADIDPLTGVLNRRAFDVRLRRLCQVAAPRQLAVLYCDLDHFKRLNDTHGHAAGDQALRSVAMALVEELRPGDVIGRMGGEEFVIVLPECDEAVAHAVASRLCERVRVLGRPPRFGPQQLTISIGVAAGACQGTAAELLDRADRALYAAKRGGRDRVVVDR